MISQKKILITGGPGSGKTTIINELKKRKFECRDEIVRDLTMKGKSNGINQVFLDNPLEFSESLMKLRLTQFFIKSNNRFIFFDRGVHEIVAYLNFLDFKKTHRFLDLCKNIKYDFIFILKPWKEVYKQDNCRYESFDESVKIYQEILKVYNILNMETIMIDRNTVEKRTDIILSHLKKF
tara:strand:+ start:1624 stop:2163 length:540 start_codon:yes stop_codon:yes gene_type:complete